MISDMKCFMRLAAFVGMLVNDCCQIIIKMRVYCLPAFIITKPNRSDRYISVKECLKSCMLKVCKYMNHEDKIDKLRSLLNQ